jgi:RNAse (barnase) inhibitor barstar
MTATPIARLLNAGPPGIFVLEDSVPRPRIAALARLRGLHEFEVDCRGVRNKRRLMAALRRGLALPDYFGANWDALADCLTDLEWAAADGYVLVFRGVAALARQSPVDYRTLLEVLSEAVSFWQQEDVPFYVLLAGETAELGSDLAAISA